MEGTKAVEVCPGPVKKKMMIWEASLCGSGLEKNIKEAIDDHLDAQGAMNAAEYKKEGEHMEWHHRLSATQRNALAW